MQAVILVGGEGTRLRPLTSRQPKPVITLVDRPFLVYMLEWLRGHGVDDVILSCGFEPTRVREALGDGSALGLRLRYVVEPEPRGTAGALRYADELGGLDERFLMLNGDVLTDVDVTRPAGPARGDRRDRDARPRARRRPVGLRPRALRRRRRRSPASSRSRRQPAAGSTATSSRPASTCSSARCST